MSNISITRKDPIKICRLCMNSEIISVNIYSFLSEFKSELANIIMECTPVQIAKYDGLPEIICTSCYSEVKKIHQFQTQAAKSDKTLRLRLQQLYKQSESGCTSETFENLNIKTEPLENTDLNILCRLCMATDGTMVNIFIEEKLAEDIMKYTPISISEYDDLPNVICTSCHTELDKVHQFQTKAIESERAFRRCFLQHSAVIQNGSEVSEDCKRFNFVDVRKNTEDSGIDIFNALEVKMEEPSNDLIEGHNYNENNWNAKGNERPKMKKKKHICAVCNKAFGETSSLKKHMLVHTGVKLCRCDLCSKCFTLPHHLNRHKLTHTGEKPHECDVCNKGFIQLTNLNRHKLTHTGEKPHKCDICDKGFARPDRVMKHKRAVHFKIKKK